MESSTSPRKPLARKIAAWLILSTVCISSGLHSEKVGDAVNTVAKPSGEMRPGHAKLACAECHRGVLPGIARNVPMVDQGAREAMAARCIVCHEPMRRHHPQKNVETCLDCHKQEHHGRETFYQVPDATCVACHQKALVREDGQPSKLRAVASLEDHPEFAILRAGPRSDPARLKFPHEVHQKVDLPRKDGKKIGLTCASCHEPDASGRHFFSVRYEQHCATCHVLAVRLPAELNDPIFKPIVENFRGDPAPHRKPTVVEESLVARLLSAAMREPALFKAWPPDRNGKRDDDQATWLKRAARDVANPLLTGPGGCLTCHHRQGERDGLPMFEPTNISKRFLPAALFDHKPHSKIADCQTCHAAVESRDARDILVPGIATCRSCHGAPIREPLAAAGTCISCHAFHSEGKRRRTDQALWHAAAGHP